jgi:hypothetical protein
VLLADRERFSLMHGDHRLDYVVRSDRTTVTVVDRQTLGAGSPRATSRFTGTACYPPHGRWLTRTWSPPPRGVVRHGTSTTTANLLAGHRVGSSGPLTVPMRSPSRPNAATT